MEQFEGKYAAILYLKLQVCTFMVYTNTQACIRSDPAANLQPYIHMTKIAKQLLLL